MTISEQLSRLNQVKVNIRNAIIGKGIEVPVETPFNGFADKIQLIQGAGAGEDFLVSPSDVATINWFTPYQIDLQVVVVVVDDLLLDVNVTENIAIGG
jgi:hypothetical protein